MIDELFAKLAGGEHLPDVLPADPMPLFMQWFDEAARDSGNKTPDAMSLATSTRDGAPSVRFVLCKHIERDGAVDFFTNFDSRKSREMLENPRAGGAFYWSASERQVRIEGPTQRLSDAQSDAYFATRPLASRIGAWASRQSEPLESRQQFARDLIAACKHVRIDPASLLDAKSPVHVPRPPGWGGFRLRIERIELWCGASGRLHDRAAWWRELSPTPGAWKSSRLYP